MRHPSGLRDVGEIVMVIDSYPGKMKIGGRCGRIVAYDPQALADGTLAEWFRVELFDDTSPHGDRYMNPMRLGNALLEVCNISDSSDHCYEHQRAHKMTNSWEIPTPPKFSSVEEADAWMEQKALERRVVDNVRTATECPHDPCAIHGCVGPHDADLAVAFPSKYGFKRVNGDVVTILPGDSFTITQTYTL